MRRAELVTAFVLALLSLYLMWKSGEGPSWDPDIARFDNIGFDETGTPGSGFWPFWLSLAMFFSSIWIMVNWWRRTSPPSQSKEPYMDGYAWRMMLLVGGGLFAFLGLIEWLGFYFGIFFFLVYYLRFLGKHAWRRTLIISICTPVFCFFFFDVAMRIVLPKGISEPLFLPLYDIFL
ncbi:hypothetical protein AB833_10615 [Chromatiales bacterium (ex Bugula neritina AB1)]|nr:hypothetical protein AB833_10615 [Chromatiales bacterium (ex Bugula neritina AB1)]